LNARGDVGDSLFLLPGFGIDSTSEVVELVIVLSNDEGSVERLRSGDEEPPVATVEQQNRSSLDSISASELDVFTDSFLDNPSVFDG